MKQALISDIKIGKRFRKDVGDLKPLEKSISELNYLLHPVVVEKLDDGKFKLVAGRRRILACKNLGWTSIPINPIKLEFSQVAELHENGARKNFTGSEIVAISEYIAKNRIGHRPKKGEEGSPLPRGKTRDLVQEITGISHNTVTKMKNIVNAARDNPKKYQELVNELDEGKKPINKIHRKLVKTQKTEIRKKELKNVQTHLPKSIQLFNCNFKDNKILKNTVSLIFTDPPYLEDDLPIYEELAKHAMDVLKDGGSLMCYCGQFALNRVIPMLEKHGLTYQWIMIALHSGPSSIMWGRKVLVAYKPILWFVKGKYTGPNIRDVIQSQFQGKELHEWAQSTVESDYYIEFMTEQNEIVYDPFMGQGTFGISAAKLKRQFVGCEINKEHYKTAEKLITLGLKEKS